MKKIYTCLLSLVLTVALSISVFAANPVTAPDEWLENWNEKTSASGKIWQLPGEDENDRTFVWLSDNTDNTFTYSDGVSQITVRAQSRISYNAVINTVKLIDLKDNNYTFSFSADGINYSGTFTVSAKDPTFTAMFCSDPQLGRSGDNSDSAIADDAYGWERTINSAKQNGAELILSAGDQVNDGFSQKQYNALFSPDALSSLPIASTAGNHDFYSPLFGLYFGDSGIDSTGNNYYFSYGNTLFIVLDSNIVFSPIHKNTIKNAISDYPDATWRVVMLHHGAYSAGAEEFTNKICAGTLKNIFDNYDIDLVLSGHNHFYSRTYPIYNGGISTIGTVYFEAGSASGGKCGSYDSVNTDYIVYSADLTEASYSLLTFTEDTIEINSYKTDSGEVFDSFTVVRTENSEISSTSILSKIFTFFESIFAFIPALFK